MRRTLVVLVLSLFIAVVQAVPALASDCTYQQVGSTTYYNCYGSNGSYSSGSGTTVGNTTYWSDSGRVGNQPYSGQTTSTNLGNYTYSNSSGQIGSTPYSGNSTSSTLGNYTNTDYSGNVGNRPYSGLSSCYSYTYGRYISC